MEPVEIKLNVDDYLNWRYESQDDVNVEEFILILKNGCKPFTCRKTLTELEVGYIPEMLVQNWNEVKNYLPLNQEGDEINSDLTDSGEPIYIKWIE